METNFYLCILTVAALGYYRKTNISPLEKLKIDLGNIDLNRIETDSGAVMAGEIPGKGLCSYAEWLSYLIEQKNLVLLPWAISAEGGPLPEYVAAAFGGYGAIGVYSPHKSLVWRFVEQRSPNLKITGQKFLELITAQKDPVEFRKAVVESVSDYSENNFGKPVFDDTLNNFLVSPEGPDFFDYNGDSLWYELREKYVRPGRDIIITDEFIDSVYESDDLYFKGKKKYDFRENEKRSIVFAFMLHSMLPEDILTREACLAERFRRSLSDITSNSQ